MQREELIREAMKELGKSRSEKKLTALAANRPQGPRKPLKAIECNCGRGDTLIHKSRCPRGRAIKYRQSHGLPLS